VPSAVANAAAWYEIGLFSGGCPSSAILGGGIPSEGTVAHLTFAAGSATPPALGLLPKGSYGIAGVALAADCSVIASGCSAQSVSGSNALTVALTATSGSPVGACSSGSICSDGACLAGGDASVTALMSSCSLQLIGAGPLADPLTEDSTLLSAPAIAATPNGFLIAYREFDSNGGSARLTTLAIDEAGAAASPIQTTLPGSCVSSPQTDATGLVFSGTQGTIALSRPVCSAGADDGGAGDAASAPGGVDVISVDAAGNVGQSSFNSQPGLNVTLAQGHAMAQTPLGLVLAYTNTSSGTSFAATLSGVVLASSPAPVPYATLTGLPTVTAAYVTGTNYGTAFLAIGAGVDGGDAAASSGPSASVATRALDAGAPSKPSTFPATWASIGATGSRVLVASNGASNGDSILYTAFDMATAAPATSGAFSPASSGDVAFVDVALVQDLAFFAAEVDQDISLFAFEKASTNPIFLQELPFSTNPVIPLGALRDGLVGVAATATRVAVVWGTGMTLGSDDDVGGYAVFGCAP